MYYSRCKMMDFFRKASVNDFLTLKRAGRPPMTDHLCKNRESTLDKWTGMYKRSTKIKLTEIIVCDSGVVTWPGQGADHRSAINDFRLDRLR